MQILGQVVISGLLLGGVYALMSVGLTIIFGVMRVVNFAHGDFIMFGMYAAVILHAAISLDPYLTAVLTIPLFFGAGLLMHRWMIKPLVERGASHGTQAIATLGLSFVFVNSILLFDSGRSHAVYTSYGSESFRILGFSLSVPRVLAFLAAAATGAVLIFVLYRTTLGRAIRATAQDRKAAEVLGINTGRVDALAFGIGTALAGIAGALMIPFFVVSPPVGLELALASYVIVVLGGMGSVAGSILGGLIIGVAEGLTGYLLDPELKKLFYLMVFVAVLILRPSGIFGIKGAEKLGEG